LPKGERVGIWLENRVVHRKMIQKCEEKQEKLARKDQNCYTFGVKPFTSNPFLSMLTKLDVKKSSTNTGVKIFSFDGELDETNVDATFPSIIADI
jgi:hypothetical protein